MARSGWVGCRSRRWLVAFVLWGALPAGALSPQGSLLPLDTERAATLPGGASEFSVGVAYHRDERFPAFTPRGVLRSQDLLLAPQLGFRIGAGSWAEIQLRHEMVILDETYRGGGGEKNAGSGDLRFHTKVRFWRETARWPGLAVRFGTKLPNATRARRMGTDETDFDLAAIGSKDFGPLAVHVNLGLLLLGNPGSFFNDSIPAGGQDDLFTYAVAVESAPLGAAEESGTQVRLLAEMTGLAGSKKENDRSHLLGAVRVERGSLALFFGPSLGLLSGSEDFGVRGGILYRFGSLRAFGRE